jgi:hypothetical protein
MTFDLWGQNAGRCSRRAASNATRINEVNVCASGRKLVSDGATHDAGADDGDLHMGILSGLSALGSVRLWALGLP